MNSEIRKQRLKKDLHLAKLRVKKESEFDYDLIKRDIIDSTGKVQSATDWLTKALGTSLPKEKQYTCQKCGKVRTFKTVKPRKITNNPKDTVTLCYHCNKLLVKLYIRGSQIAHGNKETQPIYTDKLRTALVNWYIKTPNLLNVKTFSKYTVREALKTMKFKIRALNKKETALIGPWKWDFKNNCVKCNRAYHLQKHHITYNPDVIVFLCETCHSRITGLNTRAANIAHTSKVYKPAYTNRVRIILWRWFMCNPWPVKDSEPVRRLSKTLVKNILFKLQPKPNPSKTNKNLLESNSLGHKLVSDIGLS